MSEEKKEPLTAEELDARMTPGEEVHVFDNPAVDVLVGADWSRKHLLLLARENGAELAGAMASKMGHGAVVWTKFNGKPWPLFVSTAKEP